MRCGEVKKELYLYITDEIDAVKKVDVEKHLKLCSMCSGLRESFVKLLGDINKNRIVYPRKNWDFFAEKVLDRVYEKRHFVFWKPAMAVVFSLVVVVISYRQFYQRKLEPETEELVAYLSDFDISELNAVVDGE